MIGVIGMAQPWIGPHDIQTEGGVVRPTDTIMIVEKHNTDVVKAGDDGNSTFWGPGPLITNIDSWDFTAPQEAPNGTLPGPGSVPYPKSANGAVSASHNGLANFLMVDGHVKAMYPYLTNPDPVKQPDNNMYDSYRP
jgi:prepilin-type processing-associated H-X9-DG protein